VGAARPSAPQSSNIKSGIAKGVRSTVNDPATRPAEEEGERERKRTRKRKRKRTLRFEKVLLPTRSSLIQAGSSGSKSFAHPRGGPVGRNSPCRPPCYASACAMNNSCFAQFMFRTCPEEPDGVRVDGVRGLSIVFCSVVGDRRQSHVDSHPKRHDGKLVGSNMTVSHSALLELVCSPHII
jgi:hypothetical protein